MQGDRNLRDVCVTETRADDHLGRELHAGALLIEFEIVPLGKAAQTAVDVVDRGLEPPSGKAGEERVADVPVRERHGTWRNGSTSTGKTAPLNEVVACAQRCHELRDLEEVVAVVGVSHNDELPVRCLDSSHQRTAVAGSFHMNQPRAELLGNRLRSVGAPIVCDHDLAVNARIPQSALRLFDAGTECLCLVQARDDDR